MKKSTLEAIRNYLNTTNAPASLCDEVNAEWARLTSKAAANAKAYSEAKDTVLGVMSAEPMTAEQIYNACADSLPEDFTKNKVQYALLHYWEADVVKTENGKNPNTYALKNAD